MENQGEIASLDPKLIESYPKVSKAFASMPDRFCYALTEKHPRLMDNLESVWGTRQCIDFLDGLMLADRPDRQGFSLPVMSDLMVLKEVHETLFPALSFNANDPFSTIVFDAAASEDRNRGPAKTGSASERRSFYRLGGSAPPLTSFGRSRPAGEAAKAEETGEKKTEPMSVAGAAEGLSRWPMLDEIGQFQQIVEKRRQGEAAPPRDKRKLLEILKSACRMEEKQLAAAINAHLKSGKKEPLGKYLIEMGVVTDEDVTRALCLQNGIPLVNLRKMSITTETMKKVPVDVARLKRVVPVAMIGNVLFLAVENPFVFGDREYFAFLTNRTIELVMASRNQITARLADYGQARNAKEVDEAFRDLAQKALAPMGSAAADEEEAKGPVISTEDATVVDLVNKMILDAAEYGASDIHIERFPGVPSVQIRFRRDGMLEQYSEYPAVYHDAVISRIKIIANLDITEKRRPQDGKISFARQGKDRLDLRVATLPTIRNIENAVIRILASGEPLSIADIGLNERDSKVFRQMIARPYGLILVCGPTGSGKTTTLHSVLKELNTPDRKIWTIEDPVEIVQRNINQMQVNSKIGLTFAAALRSFLRADPDVIMVGEMRDEETVRTALEASMTGHLVLSTLHTNTAAETVARMLDLGADPFNFSDALVGIIAQRLTRCLCPCCKQRRVLGSEEANDLADEFYFSGFQRNPSAAERDRILKNWVQRFGENGELALWQGRGCDHCNGKGYKGRMPIFEVLFATQELRHLVRTRAPATELLAASIAHGMYTLKQDGIEKALARKTDMTEVRGVCN